MISFRYHIVSIVAVFLALALGIVIGASGLRGAVLDDLHKQVKSLRAENSSLRGTNDKLHQQADDADNFASAYSAKVLAGALNGKGVAVIAAPGVKLGGDQFKGVVAAVQAAGGTVTAKVALTAEYVATDRQQSLRDFATGNVHPEGLQYPQTDDAGSVAASLLGYVLVGHGADAATDLSKVIAGMTSNGTMSVSSEDPKPGASLAVVVTAGTSDGKDTLLPSMVSLVTQFSGGSLNTAVAGDVNSAQKGGVVAAVRENAIAKVVSTVDNSDTALGQVSCALALSQLGGGTAGQYGTGPGAKDLFPTPVK